MGVHAQEYTRLLVSIFQPWKAVQEERLGSGYVSGGTFQDSLSTRCSGIHGFIDEFPN